MPVTVNAEWSDIQIVKSEIGKSQKCFSKASKIKHLMEIHKLYDHKPLLDSQKKSNEMVLSILNIPMSILDVFYKITNGSYTFRRFLHTHTYKDY